MPLYQYINGETYLRDTGDPDNPSEDEGVIWQSDGVGLGNDGDILAATTVGGVTRWGTLFTFSGGAVKS